MEDLTMGQRIAACRKNLGLSQEALGEKMGVSRQAISKWEADAAMPEIDKLIGLCKLYNVSVGWLLGVEESSEPKEERADISEELLRKIEEIVLRYQPRKAPLSKTKKLLIAIAAVLVLLLGISLFSRWGQLQLDMVSASAQIRFNNEQNAQIMEKLSDLESRMEEPESSLLSSYKFEIFPMYIISKAETSDAEIHFSAVPRTWKEGDTGILSIRHSTLGTIQEECDWDGSFLSASTPLGSAYGYELCFTVRHADGTQEQQMLQDEAVEKLSKTLTVDFQITRGSGEFSEKDGVQRLTLKDYRVYVEKPAIAQPGDTWAAIDFVLYHHHGLEHEAIGTYDMLGPHEPGDLILQAATLDVGGIPEYILPEAEEGDGLVLWLDIRMSNGMRTFTIIDQWNYRDGSYSNPGGTYEYN